MVVIKIIAIRAQSIFLVVSRVPGYSLVGVDWLHLRAHGVFFCHHRRGHAAGRVGSGIVCSRVLRCHDGRKKAKPSNGAHNVSMLQEQLRDERQWVSSA